MICEKCKPTELEAMRALESLTPSGSEFVNDPKRCVNFVREHRETVMRVLVSFKKELNVAEARLRELGQTWDGCKWVVAQKETA